MSTGSLCNYSWQQAHHMASLTAQYIINDSGDIARFPKFLMYPIPHSGTPAVCLIRPELKRFGVVAEMTEDPRHAHIYVDDYVDTTETALRVFSKYGTKPLYALLDGRKEKLDFSNIRFPWTHGQRPSSPSAAAHEAVREILTYIGEDPDREGLRETPHRVVRSFAEIYGGYKKESGSVFKTFEDGKCDEMVLLKNIEFFSTCEHHMQPFFGKAHIAYIPNKSVIGVSKLARLMEIHARRLQIQERLTEAITKDLDQHLAPLGSACMIEAKHFCMVCRGVNKQNSEMVTSSLTGAFRDKPEARAEFYSLVNR
jgi:GTP cyclohydrolase I